jgi:hypothetical protein
MRWSPRGAHLLLQIRTRVLNDDLAGDFRRWYPALMPTSERQAWRRELPHFVPLSFNRNELVHSDQGERDRGALGAPSRSPWYPPAADYLKLNVTFARWWPGPSWPMPWSP